MFVSVDFSKQVIRFKVPGRAWKKLAFWFVAEIAGIDGPPQRGKTFGLEEVDERFRKAGGTIRLL